MIENNPLYSFTRENVPQSLRNKLRSTMRLMVDGYAGLRGLNPKNATPDFLMVGAQKAGTTSLFNWLVESGFVQSPLVKEIGFFNTRWNRPVKYRGYFQPKQAGILVGEATPSYLAFPEVPERVLSELGSSCKIIIVLRNPIDRSVSHYFHEKRLGFENREMFEAMSAEEDLIREAFDEATTVSRRQEILTHYSYMYRSAYLERLKPWFKHFPRENILLVNSESMFEDPKKTVENVATFLDAKVRNPINYKARNRNSYNFEDPRVASLLEDRLSDELATYNSWSYDAELSK